MFVTETIFKKNCKKIILRKVQFFKIFYILHYRHNSYKYTTFTEYNYTRTEIKEIKKPANDVFEMNELKSKVVHDQCIFGI